MTKYGPEMKKKIANSRISISIFLVYYQRFHVSKDPYLETKIDNGSGYRQFLLETLILNHKFLNQRQMCIIIYHSVPTTFFNDRAENKIGRAHV